MSSSPDPDAPFGRKARTGEPRKSLRGRPTLLSDEKIALLLKAISMFAPVETACRFAGINKELFYRWLKTGAKHRKEKRDTKYSRFSDAIEKAMGQVELNCLAVIIDAAQGAKPVTTTDKRGKKVVLDPGRRPEWTAVAWLLERRHPQSYARRTYRIEEERTPQASVGAVEPYRVLIPEVDPIEPVAPPRPETAREDQVAAEDVKRKQHESDGGS